MNDATATTPVIARFDPIAEGIYGKAGERLYCANGHHIATLVNDAVIGKAPIPADLKFEPGCSFLMHTCPACNGPCTLKGAYFFADPAA